MPPVSSVLGNCVVGRVGIKASPSAACARGTGRDGLKVMKLIKSVIACSLRKSYMS